MEPADRGADQQTQLRRLRQPHSWYVRYSAPGMGSERSGPNKVLAIVPTPIVTTNVISCARRRVRRRCCRMRNSDRVSAIFEMGRGDHGATVVSSLRSS
jgi:hypothetical protein